MRVDPKKPDCDPAALAAPPAETEDEEDDDLDELLDDDDSEESDSDQADEDSDDDSDEDEDDDLDDLLGDDDEEINEEDLKAAREKARQECVEKHEEYASFVGRITTPVRIYRSFETAVADVVRLGDHHARHLLILLLLFAAIIATNRHSHISLRHSRSRFDYRVAGLAQLASHAFLFTSALQLFRIDQNEGIHEDNAQHYMWMFGFGIMALQNLFFMARPPKDAESDASLGRALMCVPLFAYMALISGFYFFFVEGHWAGLAIYLGKLTEFRMLYLAVGLYVWVGMLLKQSRLPTLFFDVLRPWKLTPEVLSFVVVVLAAFPTAYSGASGIFVIAAGALIFREMQRAGARTHLAVATTAMAGSMGVVLSPCLLVVIVASLNKQVTTDELYGWGIKVYLLSALLFLIGVLVTRRQPVTFASPSEAGPGMLKAIKRLGPYFFIGVLIWALYRFGLNTPVNEHTASLILPIMLLLILSFDVFQQKRGDDLESDPGDIEPETQNGFVGKCVDATSETSGHIGALLMLMMLSVCLGGVVERSEVMLLFPQTFGSPTATMAMLVGVLVIIGMTMDPYGAVILVSASIANIAYDNGVNPIHFWMVVLCAFELGYLTPPVALNHLFTRQVVGDEAMDDDSVEGASFWWRHERVLLPVTVMGVRFLIVAFVPLWF